MSYSAYYCLICGHEICEECLRSGVIWCDYVIENGDDRDLCCDGECKIEEKDNAQS